MGGASARRSGWPQAREDAVNRLAEGGHDGGYDVVDLFGCAVARGDADDVAFDEGVVGVADDVGGVGGEVLG